MKKDNIVKLLSVALVVAIISTGLFYGLFVNKAGSATVSRTLLVAAKPLKPGTVLTATDVKAVAWPTEAFPKGAYQKPEEVMGSTVFDTIGAQEPVLSARLTSSRDGSGGGVPQGKRAVSVHVADSTGVLAMLRNGEKVDVQVIIPRSNAIPAEVRTAIENLTVLSMTPQVEQSFVGQNLPVVTLLATPAEADVLALADSGARVRLTLRNPLDETGKPRTALSLDTVMRGGAGTQ